MDTCALTIFKLFFLFFFFQAEDGIRDYDVTGVQTCALPILVYVLLWEGVTSTFMSGVDYLSVRGYSLAIMSGLDEASFPALEDRVIELPVAIGGAAVVTVVFLLLGVRRLQRMDVP